MAVKGYDVEIAGQGFNLAEDAEGNHFSLTGEPLRPPNAVTVQGEQRNRFQIRPDILLWTLTDWSGGEGQIKYSFQAPNRWRELNLVRVFDTPGAVTPGWATETLEDATVPLAVDGPLVVMNGTLYLLDDGAASVYAFNAGTGKWGSSTALTGPSGGASHQAAADGSYIYWHESGTDNVWKWNGTTTTQIDSAGMANFSNAMVAQLGAYVYVYDPTVGEVWEIAKAGTSETLIDDFGDDPSLTLGTNQSGIVVLDGKVYVLTTAHDYATIREITPTTAAGTGFGAEIARFPGFLGQALWAHSGSLYVFGRYGAPNDATVMYLTPGGEYGTLGKVRAANYSIFGSGGHQNGQMLTHYFGAWDGTNYHLYEIDAPTGGFARIAEIADSDTVGQAVLLGQDGLFCTTKTVSGELTYRADPDNYVASCSTISPWHDFDLADAKILSSLVLSVEALPADWTVYVDYAINGVDSWTNAIAYTTLNGTGTTQQVSTNTSTIKFRTLSVRLRMVYGGAGVPTSGPVVHGVDVRAQVAKQQPVYRLLLDLDDDKSRTPGGLSGAKKFALLKAAAAAENVVAFKDGYSDRSTITETDVVIDSYGVLFSVSGEAVAEVTLREVI